MSPEEERPLAGAARHSPTSGVSASGPGGALDGAEEGEDEVATAAVDRYRDAMLEREEEAERGQEG